MNPFDMLASGRRHLPAAVVGSLIRSGKGAFRLRAFGTSMLPAIPAGSLLEIERVERSAAKAGDVVMVLRREEPLVHRLVDRNGALFLKGDALELPDGPLDQFEWVGRVTRVTRPSFGYRVLRRLKNLLRTSATLLAPHQRPRA